MGSRLIATGRPRTCNISTKESYPSTRPKLGDWHGAPSHSSYWVMKRSSTTAAPQTFSNDAYPSPKDRSYCRRHTRGLAATMQHLEPSLGTPSDKASTGRLRWPTPLGLYAPAEGVNSMRDRRTCPRRSLAEGTRGLLAPAGRHRQILQVDRGPTPNQHQVRASSIALGSQTPSSPIMARSSLGRSSWTSARTTTSMWTGPPCSPHDEWAGGACQRHDSART
jgi:hypothetical protein